jgi:hypothetical protein
MASKYIPGSENISNISKQVGINTLNPNYTLDINGTVNFSGQLLQNGNPFIPSILPTGTNYGDYIYWNGTGSYVVGNTNIKLGANAGQITQGEDGIAIGNNAGNSNQQQDTVAVGAYAGQTNQGTGSVSIGVNAGSSNQGEYSIALGYNAGDSSQPANSIILNANSASLNATTEGFFVNPVRNVYNSDILVYDNSTSEISYTNVTTLLQTGPRGPTGAGAGGALGYYGSFFDTTIQTNVPGGNTGIAMTYNTTAEANGISIVDNSKITFEFGAVYNLQFSAQFDKTDSGTDEVDIWLSQNGQYLEWTSGKLTSVGNNDKFMAAWNYVITVNGGDYLELYWASSDVNMRVYAEASGTVPFTRPGIPSVIVTVQQVMFTQLGPTGPTGPQGIQGQTGPTGPQGPQGITSGRLYYLNISETGSLGSPYGTLSTSAVVSNTGYTTTLSLPTSGNTGTLASFVTNLNEPGAILIPPGIWNATLFLSATVAGGGQPLTDIQVYTNYYTYSTGGVTTFLDRSSIQPITTTSASPYQLSAQFDPTIINTNDRIIMEIVCNNVSSPSKAVTVTGYFQDSTYSNLVTSFSSIAVGATGPQGSTGPAGPIGGTNTQIIFNSNGNATGSNDLFFNNSLLSTTNLSVSLSGSFNNLFLNNNTIHLGTNAGSTSQGSNSIAIGGSAGFSSQNTNAVAIGNSAGNTTQGQFAIGIGYRAGGTTQGTSTVAIGQDAGRLTQGNSSIAIGPSAGYSLQSNNSIAIGNGPGYTSQGSYAIAIGDNTGQINQSLESIAIGRNAGFTNLGQYSIAIGKNASQNTGVANSIVLNAQNAALDATQSGFYVNPVRTFNGTGSNFLTYTNNEITQDSNFIFNQSTGYVMNKSLTIQTGSNLNAPGTYHVRLGLTSDQSLTGPYDYRIPFSSFSDPNNWYNASTYRITPTVSGYYYVSYQVNCGSGTPGNQTNAQIRKNNGTIAISVFPVSTVSNYTINTSSTVYLNGISDYIDCTVFTSSTTTQTVTGEAQGTWTKLDMFKLN